jgi:5-methylcytosine-specific restriction endonuclease McrA
MKSCTKCGKEKVLDDFPFDKRTKDGRVTICRICTKIQQTAWRHLNREHWNEKSRNWAENNPEKYKEIQSKWHTSEEALAQRRQWKKNNRVRVQEINEQRRILKSGVTVEDVRRSVVWERDRGICHICLDPADINNWHLEHKIALSNGGKHSYDNVAVSHPICNLRKANK